MLHTERRKTPRIPVRKFGYINFEPYNNGGVINDISGAGVRFRTVEPLQQGGLLCLTIILGAANQIEAVGELIWTDATRRNGGVRFAILPTGAADQIRNWAEELDGAETSQSGLPPRNGESYETPIPNETSFQPEAASALPNRDTFFVSHSSPQMDTRECSMGIFRNGQRDNPCGTTIRLSVASGHGTPDPYK